MLRSGPAASDSRPRASRACAGPCSRVRHALRTATAAAALALLAAFVPSASAIDFSVAQNADLQLGAPAGSWTDRTQHSAALMSYGMGSPLGVAVDTSGSVYVVDRNSERVMRWGSEPTTDGQAVTNVFPKSDASTASWAQSCVGGTQLPESVAVAGDSSPVLVVDRYAHRVLVFATEPTTNAAAASSVIGQATLSACSQDGGGTINSAGLNAPSDAWTDGTRVAVADTANHRVLLWNSFPTSGQAADRVLGQANFTSGAANRGGSPAANTMSSPKGVFFDGTYLYVGDTANNRVLVFNGWPSSNGPNANYVIGQPDMTTFNSGCSATKLNYPTGVTASGTGASQKLAIASERGHRVVILNGWAGSPASSPTWSSVLGQANSTSCNVNRGSGPGANTLFSPSKVAFDPSDRLWVVDRENQRTVRFPALATGTSADRVLGQTNLTSSTMMGGTNANAFYHTTGSGAAWQDGSRIATDASGAVVVTHPLDSSVQYWATPPSTDNEAFTWRLGHSSRSIGGANHGRGLVDSTSLSHPMGIWFDGTRLLVADERTNRVLAWTSPPTSDTDPPDYVIGQANFTSNSAGTTQATLSGPTDVTSDGIDVYVADQDNNRVLIYRNFWLVPSNGPAASVVLGQANFTSSSTGTTSSTMNAPTALSVDNGGHLAVADRTNNRILVFNGTTSIGNGAAASAVIGQANFTSSGGGGIASMTTDVVLAGGGVVWTSNCTTYVRDPLPTSGAVTAAPPQLGSGCAVTTTGQNRLSAAAGVDAAAGRVWVSNSEQARMMRWTDTTAPTITVAPSATTRCDGTVTVSWSTSESTTTDIKWDTVSRGGAWGAAWANQQLDPAYTGLSHSVDLSFSTPGTKYAMVRAVDWAGQTVYSSEINFTVPSTCPAPTTMLADDVNAQSGFGRANPSTTSAPPINSPTFHSSWQQSSGVTMDAVNSETWTTPPEHTGGLWRMNNSTAADTWSQATGAITWFNAPPYGAGRFGQGITLNGTNQYGTIPHDTNLTKNNDFTVDLWFRTTADLSAGTTKILATKGGCGADCTYSLETRTGPERITAAVFANGSQRTATWTTGALDDGAWHHAALTVDSGNFLRLYVDGELQAGPTNMTGTAAQNTKAVSIGATDIGGLPWPGDIDELRFSPVAYNAAAIRGYFRARRPHAERLWDVPSAAIADCATGSRCVDQVYAGAPEILRDGARYWQRTRFNTKNNDYWTTPAIDWFETTNTTSLSITAGSNVAFGTIVPGQDSFASSTLQVSTNGAAGYQLLAHDESDTWGVERTDAGASVADRQDGSVAPAPWASGAAGFFGVSVRSATGSRLPKWGTVGGPWPREDVANNYYTGLEGTSDVELHRRDTYGTGTDAIELIWRVNPLAAQPAGTYDGVVTLTAIANP